MVDFSKHHHLHKTGMEIMQHHPIGVVISKENLHVALKEGLDETPIKPAPLRFQAKYLNADVELVMSNAYVTNSDWWVFFREEHREQAMLFKMSYG